MADLLISVGDYVIVQDGQIDQPKMVVWDDVAVADVVGELSNDLLITVFDAIVTEDPVQPALVTSLAVSVFDSVRVQEGQADSDALNASVSDDVTVAESVAGQLSLLRVTASDVVTVVDEPGVFAQGPLGVLTNETVTVQEFQTVRMSLYINAYEDVSVVDGALAPDVNDAVTVAEDVTVKLAWLLVSVSEDVTVTEYTEVFGPAVDVGTSVFDDLVTSESVTVFLTNLVPTASTDVTVAESVTVSITSINLSIDVADAVTVAEYIEPQTNPMQIVEFTEILVAEDISIHLEILYIDVADAVTVSDSVTMQLLPILLDVAEDVTVTERVALRIGTGGRKRHDLTVLGAGE